MTGMPVACTRLLRRTAITKARRQLIHNGNGVHDGGTIPTSSWEGTTPRRSRRSSTWGKLKLPQTIIVLFISVVGVIEATIIIIIIICIRII